MDISAGSLYFTSHLDFYPLYHLLLFLVSSIFLLPSLREALFMLCCFSLILSYCPFYFAFFHTISVQNSFLEFSNLSWSCMGIKSPFSPEKLCSVTASYSSSLLSVSLVLLSCVYNPYFHSSCGGPHTRSHSMWPGVPGTQSWSLSHSLLNEIIHMDTG